MRTTLTANSSLHFRLRGRRLLSARLAWVGVTFLVILVSAHSIYISIHSASIAAADHLNAVGDVGQRLVYGPGGQCITGCISLTQGQATIIHLALWSVYLWVAAILFARKSDEISALVASLFLVAFGASVGTGVVYIPDHFPPVPWILALHVLPVWYLLPLLIQLGGTATIIVGCVFPDGRFIPRWTRWLLGPVAAYIAFYLYILVLNYSHLPFITQPAFLNDQLAAIPGLKSGLGGQTPYTTLSALGHAPDLLIILMLAAQVYRYRRVSNSIQRQQTKWVVYGVTIAIAGSFPLNAAYYLGVGPDTFPFILIGQCFQLIIPVTISLAIMRYRLWDIDLIINRTLVYGLLTLGVIGFYVLLVAVLGSLVQGQAHLASSLLATGLVALLFHPVRQRLQWGVNRLMYGERDEPYAVLSRLGQRLDDTLAPDTLLPTIVQTIAEALKLPYAALVLPQEGELALAASVGSPPPAPLRVPLVHQGESVGQLLLAPRPGEHSFSTADRRLLDDLARQAGVALHAVQLAVDLQRSRERLVTLREEERRRLRRDLHDGLGPALASIGLNLTAIRHQIGPHSSADPLLQETRAYLQAVIADLRRLVYDLRPPALDQLGLAGAIRQSASSYEQEGLLIAVQGPDQLPPLPAAVEVAAYRIIQEALTNVARHAQAHSCTIQLSLTESLDLAITDDGKGLPPERHAGVGLSSMRERAAELGGSCVIEPAPTGGTQVRARLPLPGA
ncbi:MAG TPA: GAF domain-containing sensor histidine kinase [Chloroflexota bacterium]